MRLGAKAYIIINVKKGVSYWSVCIITIVICQKIELPGAKNKAKGGVCRVGELKKKNEAGSLYRISSDRALY